MNTIDDSTAIALGWATFVGGVALYIWIAAALAALFRKSGEEGWKGWVPILNQVVLLQLGGLSGWLVLLILFPVLGGIALWVFLVVAAHRIGRAFGYGPGMTVLAALLFPVWASVIGFGSARWIGGERVAAGPAQGRGPVRHEGGPVRSSDAAPPVTRPAPSVPERPAAPAGYAPVAPPPAYGRAPEPPAAAPTSRSQAPLPASEPVRPEPDGWTPPPVPPAAPAAAAQAAETAPTPAGARRSAPEWVPAAYSSDDARDAEPHEATGEVTAAVPGAPAPVSALPSVPAPTAPLTPPGPTRAAARAAASDDEDLDADAPTEAPAFPPVTRVPGAPAPSTAREPWAPARSPMPGDGEVFPDSSSAAVSAIAGAPVAGTPRSARASVSALHPRPHIPDDDELDKTVVARRKRTAWSLVPLQGTPIPLLADVVIVGRRPASDPAFPDAQLLAVDDETRTVSKTHARLELRDDRWYITDLDSTNGVLFTTLMGTEVAATPGVEMEAGERFFLGDAEFAMTRNET